MILFLKGKSGKYQIQPKFSIELHKKYLLLLKRIQEFFNGIGVITLNNNRNSAVFRVLKLKDITNIIIPHFMQYPLLSQKRADFELFKAVIELMNKGEHLTKDGFRKILAIRASMNNGLSPEFIESFPGIKPVARPLVDLRETPDPH